MLYDKTSVYKYVLVYNVQIIVEQKSNLINFVRCISNIVQCVPYLYSIYLQ